MCEHTLVMGQIKEAIEKIEAFVDGLEPKDAELKTIAALTVSIDRLYRLGLPGEMAIQMIMRLFAIAYQADVKVIKQNYTPSTPTVLH